MMEKAWVSAEVITKLKLIYWCQTELARHPARVKYLRKWISWKVKQKPFTPAAIGRQMSYIMTGEKMLKKTGMRLANWAGAEFQMIALGTWGLRQLICDFVNNGKHTSSTVHPVFIEDCV